MSQTDFFLTEADVQLFFAIDTQGKATSAVLHQNGHDVPATTVQ